MREGSLGAQSFRCQVRRKNSKSAITVPRLKRSLLSVYTQQVPELHWDAVRSEYLAKR